MVEHFIKCGTDKKDKDYPMCYFCFIKWLEEKQNPKPQEYMFINDE